MIHTLLFEDKIEIIDGIKMTRAEEKLEYFLNANGIAQENIVSISLAVTDRNDSRNKILLVWSN